MHVMSLLKTEMFDVRIDDDIAAGRLLSLLPDWPLPTLPIHTVHPSRHLVPRRVRTFIEAVAGAFASEA